MGKVKSEQQHLDLATSDILVLRARVVKIVAALIEVAQLRSMRDGQIREASQEARRETDSPGSQPLAQGLSAGLRRRRPAPTTSHRRGLDGGYSLPLRRRSWGPRTIQPGSRLGRPSTMPTPYRQSILDGQAAADSVGIKMSGCAAIGRDKGIVRQRSPTL